MKSVLTDAGTALMGVGVSSGEGRAEKAAIQAINSPLLDISINGARGVLFAISSNDDLTMAEFQDSAKVITESIDKDARVIIGTIMDDRMKKGEMKITVIATGFPTETSKKQNLFGGNAQQLFTRNEQQQSAALPQQQAPQQAEREQVKPMVQKADVRPVNEPGVIEPEGTDEEVDNKKSRHYYIMTAFFVCLIDFLISPELLKVVLRILYIKVCQAGPRPYPSFCMIIWFFASVYCVQGFIRDEQFFKVRYHVFMDEIKRTLPLGSNQDVF
jgi:hypothetical protein